MGFVRESGSEPPSPPPQTPEKFSNRFKKSNETFTMFGNFIGNFANLSNIFKVLSNISIKFVQKFRKC